MGQGAQIVYFAFEHTDSSLFKQFRDVVLGYSHIESMWNKRSQPLRSVLDCEEPGEVEECIQVYLKTKSQVLVVSSKASTCSGNIARSDVFEPFGSSQSNTRQTDTRCVPLTSKQYLHDTTSYF